jgi:hypothetical protein
MADLPSPATGDALSKLIQLQASRHDIRLAWTGHGVQDLTALMYAHSTKARMAKHLWTSTRELLNMPEMNELPEPIQAQIACIILKAQALLELENEERAKKAATASNRPPGAA